MSILPGIRVRYCRERRDAELFRVEIVARSGETLSVGHVLKTEDGRWRSYPRGALRRKAVNGFVRRTDAAAFAVIATGHATHAEHRRGSRDRRRILRRRRSYVGRPRRRPDGRRCHRHARSWRPMSTDVVFTHAVQEVVVDPTTIPTPPRPMLRLNLNAPAPEHSDGMLCSSPFWLWFMSLVTMELAVVVAVLQ